MNYNFGEIIDIPVRNVWKDEAHDFTPWLSKDDGLCRLGKAIDRNLYLISTEQYVGKYRYDILAKDDNDDRYIIENKFEQMDHDHLGKALVYAAGTDAKHIIWIVEYATPEHSKAIELLNSISNGKLDFMLIEIHAKKIGESPIVPFFEIIEQPNSWTQSVEKCRNDATASIYADLFAEFQDFIKSNISNEKYVKDAAEFIGSKPLLRTPTGKPYHDLVSKNKVCFTISASSAKNEVKVGIYIRRENVDTVKAIENIIPRLKQTFKDNLVEGGENNLALSIRTTFDISDKSMWPKIFEWYCLTIIDWKFQLNGII